MEPAGDAATGYVPYYGPDVAAFSPMQEASFESTDMMASRLVCQRAEGQQYMPEAQTLRWQWGYSSAPIYVAAVKEFQKGPGQAENTVF